MRIGELAKRSATKAETVRFYEKSGLIAPPPRTEGNYRDYSLEQLARLQFIRRARKLGFSLDDVRELLVLADDRTQPCHAVDQIASTHLEEIESKLVDLQQMRDELANMVSQCHEGTVAECRIIETLRPKGAA